MAEYKIKFDEGIRIMPTKNEGTRNSDIWISSVDNKLKIMLEGIIKEFGTSVGNAENITFDNSSSKLNATNVQDAIDELNAIFENLITP